MAANQPPWPREWLMTDERIDQRLWEAIETLPQGAGIVFRHYSLSGPERLALGLKVAEAVRQAGLVLAVARSRQLADKLGASLVHNPGKPGVLPCSMAVHDLHQAEAANMAGAALAFVAPIYPTRSHPGAMHLDPDKAAELAQTCHCPVIAVGGMDAARFDALQAATSDAFHGYAGIDCWLRT